MIAHVALPLPIGYFFSYRIPEDLEGLVRPLARVRVPFRQRTLIGFVMEVAQGDGDGLKDLAEVLDFLPYLGAKSFRLCQWASHYYVAPLGIVLKHALPPSIDPDKYFIIKGREGSAEDLDGIPLKKAIHVKGRKAVMKQYEDGSLMLQDVFTGGLYESESKGDGEKAYSAHLSLGGVDFRKSRYMARISEAVEREENVLMLLPDQHTTGDYFYRSLSERFPGRVFWYASAARKANRMEAYFRARSGKGCIVVGNKSCVFLPLSQNSLIILERLEEDEYRNEEGFKFSAVKVAMKRAELENIPIHMGSVAPSLDMVKSVEEGLITSERSDIADGTQFSFIKVDRPRYTGYSLPREFRDVVKKGISDQESFAVYVPRRDYAFHLYCLDCRSPFLCPACSGSLSYHKAKDLLFCGLCRRAFPYEEKCSDCGSSLIQFLGVGAEYVHEKLSEMLPNVPLLTITGEAVRQRDARILERIAVLPGGIVIGTNILSKLYDFRPQNLLLLGFEELLRIAGYRAKEKAFQILHNLQDALRPKRTIFFEREALDMAFMVSSQEFYGSELAARKASGFPPYKRLFIVYIDAMTGDEVVHRIEAMVQEASLRESMIGPVKDVGKRRWKILLKGETEELLPLLSSLYGMRGVRIEADPLNI